MADLLHVVGRGTRRRQLARYFPDERAGTAARAAGEICWLLFWPEAPAGNPCWPDAAEAAAVLIAACTGRLEDWGVTRQRDERGPACLPFSART